jgi:very-short-patch-repair endonuclease
MESKHQILILRARELRHEMTRQECRLWYGFLRKHPVKFYRQRVIDNFIADFYCHAAKLVIEIDGRQHSIGNSPAYDDERSKILEGYGLNVVRFTNAEVDERFNKVCIEIDSLVKYLYTEEGSNPTP